MFNLEKSKIIYPDVLRSYQWGKPPLENHNVGLHSGGLFCQWIYYSLHLPMHLITYFALNPQLYTASCEDC